MDDDTWLIAASNPGAPSHPAWCHNLLAHPGVQIEAADAGTVAVRARELTGLERDEAWTRFTTRSKGFADDGVRTPRVIPVIALTRR